MKKTFSYGKHEKLKGRKAVETIFSRGKSFTVHPLRVFYHLPGGEMEHAVKTGVGVSSRIFRKAVDRNRVKRLLREAYRTEKLPLHEYLDASGKRVLLFILYTDRSFPEYSLLKTKMHIALHRLVKELHEASPANT